MFKYTKESIDILVKKCKLYALIFRYVSLVTTLGLLIYQIVTGFIKGNNLVYVSVGLACTFVIFTILDFILDHYKKRGARKVAKIIYKWIKIVAQACTLGFTIYEIAVAEKLDGVQIILTTLMIMMWIASIISEVILELAEPMATELIIAIKADIEDIKRPITSVTNVVKKVTGQKVEKETIDPQKEKVLQKLRDHRKERKEAKGEK